MSVNTPHAGPRFVIVRPPRWPWVRPVMITVVWLLSLILSWTLATRHAAPTLARTQERAQTLAQSLRDAHARNQELEQQISNLRRSDQISRTANQHLQSTLTEREEEIAQMRADVAFYERLVGSSGTRRGLSVHSLHLSPGEHGTWRWQLTLTQNLNRGTVSKGVVRLGVLGTAAGKLRSLTWDELLQQPGAPAAPFSFRYFQQLEGLIMLPSGFAPENIKVFIEAGKASIEQTIPWSEAVLDIEFGASTAAEAVPTKP